VRRREKLFPPATTAQSATRHDRNPLPRCPLWPSQAGLLTVRLRATKLARSDASRATVDAVSLRRSTRDRSNASHVSGRWARTRPSRPAASGHFDSSIHDSRK
jgi:hypothetical protein